MPPAFILTKKQDKKGCRFPPGKTSFIFIHTSFSILAHCKNKVVLSKMFYMEGNRSDGLLCLVGV